MLAPLGCQIETFRFATAEMVSKHFALAHGTIAEILESSCELPAFARQWLWPSQEAVHVLIPRCPSPIASTFVVEPTLVSHQPITPIVVRVCPQLGNHSHLQSSMRLCHLICRCAKVEVYRHHMWCFRTGMFRRLLRSVDHYRRYRCLNRGPVNR
jgi:hypothetical protein